MRRLPTILASIAARGRLFVGQPLVKSNAAAGAAECQSNAQLQPAAALLQEAANPPQQVR